MTYTNDSPPPGWYDEPQGFDCPECEAITVTDAIRDFVEDQLATMGVSKASVNATFCTNEGVAFMDFCYEDVGLAVRRDGGKLCSKHQKERQ
jgi:hypothetical protein